MSLMLSPNLDPFEREIPVDLGNREAGSFRIVLQPIPVGKYRALCRDLDDKRNQLTKVGSLLDQPIDLSGDLDADQITTRVSERSKLNQLRERAEADLYMCLMALVGWGVIGYSDVMQADKTTPYQAEPIKIKWAGYEYQNLDAKSLHLFGKLGLLWHLAFIIMSAQNGQLPEALEGFFKESEPNPK